MARESVTATGLVELKRAIDAFPRTVTLALRGVAWHSSRRVQSRAKEILNTKTHGTGRTADHIVVIEDAANNQFVVDSQGDPEKPANLPLWLERGTRHMEPRAYMRPAGDEEEPHYLREMEHTAVNVATETLK